MKTTTIKSFMLAMALGIGTLLHAQTENTSERLIDQLKNGTAPGLLFSNERPAPAPAQNVKANVKESLISQIRKGTAPGMQFKQGSGGAAPLAARSAVAANKPLASEQKPVAEQVKAAPVAVPKQE
jgi:hypothetical protein